MVCRNQKMADNPRKIRNTGRLRSILINRNLLNNTLKKSPSIQSCQSLLRLLGAYCIDVITVNLHGDAFCNLDGEVRLAFVE